MHRRTRHLLREVQEQRAATICQWRASFASRGFDVGAYSDDGLSCALLDAVAPETDATTNVLSRVFSRLSQSAQR